MIDVVTVKLGHPPLSCRTSPPQGGRVDGALSPATSNVAIPDLGLAEKRGLRRLPFSPLVGEMPGRAEGVRVDAMSMGALH
jgi:hypothetical protein